jgi:hypothetical protein
MFLELILLGLLHDLCSNVDRSVYLSLLKLAIPLSKLIVSYKTCILTTRTPIYTQMCIIFKSAADNVTEITLEDVPTGKQSPQARNGAGKRGPPQNGSCTHSNTDQQLHSELARE